MYNEASFEDGSIENFGNFDGISIRKKIFTLNFNVFLLKLCERRYSLRILLSHIFITKKRAWLIGLATKILKSI